MFPKELQDGKWWSEEQTRGLEGLNLPLDNQTVNMRKLLCKSVSATD